MSFNANLTGAARPSAQDTVNTTLSLLGLRCPFAVDRIETKLHTTSRRIHSRFVFLFIFLPGILCRVLLSSVPCAHPLYSLQSPMLPTILLISRSYIAIPWNGDEWR